MADAQPGDRRTALVTGGARGLGFAIAERLLADGYAVCVVDIHERRLEELAEREQREPERFMQAFASVSDPEAVAGVVDRVVARWGRLDLLVNNAGVNRRGGIFEHTIEDWSAVLAVNLTGTFLCSRAAAPVMRDAIAEGRQPSAAIVNIGSTAGAGDGGGSIAYATTKAGIHVFTKSLAHELGPLGIRVNAIAPGATLTEWVRRNLDDLEGSAAQTPLRRLGEPEDVAAAVAFLASDEARQITGQILSVSGGSWMP
ncbi:MAG: 3-oxoacyl-ACP reductase FabG [Chloroflexi bacterium]|nr:3-oxoacyl-ACP reductase FabG [Chloroflexota bacterium]